jgi:hypothetical protein
MGVKLLNYADPISAESASDSGICARGKLVGFIMRVPSKARSSICRGAKLVSGPRSPVR